MKRLASSFDKSFWSRFKQEYKQRRALMETAAIEVKYVNAPRQGKSFGSIKDTNGVMYGVKQADLRLFQPGQRCTIRYEERNGYNNFIELAQNPAPKDGLPETTLSNVLAVLCQTDRIGTPGELAVWAVGIRNAVLAYRSGEVLEGVAPRTDNLDDEIPF